MLNNFTHLSGIDYQSLKHELLGGMRLPQPNFVPQKVYDMMLGCWEHEADARPTFSQIKVSLTQIFRDLHISQYGMGDERTGKVAEEASITYSALSHNEDMKKKYEMLQQYTIMTKKEEEEDVASTKMLSSEFAGSLPSIPSNSAHLSIEDDVDMSFSRLLNAQQSTTTIASSETHERGASKRATVVGAQQSRRHQRTLKDDPLMMPGIIKNRLQLKTQRSVSMQSLKNNARSFDNTILQTTQQVQSCNPLYMMMRDLPNSDVNDENET